MSNPKKFKTFRITFFYLCPDSTKNEILNPIMIACTDKAIVLSNIFKPTYLSLYDSL